MQIEITFNDAFELYIEEKRLHNLNEGTIRNAKMVNKWLLDNFGDCQVSPDLFKKALVQFQDRNVKASTLSMYYRTVAKFAMFCGDAKYMEPMKIPTLKEPAPAVVHLTTKQVKIIVDSFNLSSFTGLRNNAIIRLMFDSGIRRGEMLAINEDDVMWGQNMIRVVRKGNREGFVHFGAGTKRHMWEYEKQARPRRRDMAFFINKQNYRLGKDGLKMVFKRCPQFEGVKLTPHILRHSFAVNALLNGMDQISLSQLMGHTTLDMTRRYGQLAPGERAQQHKRYSPGRNI